MYHLDPFRYFMEGIITTSLAPMAIVCTSEDFLRFYAPPNVTCGEYQTITLLLILLLLLSLLVSLIK